MMRVRKALTIAGSDSGGCAGIQADLKTFAALGVHGMSVITSVTAQNTRAVLDVASVPLENVQAQLRAIAEDIGCDAVKTGMIPSAEMAELIADTLGQPGWQPLVVDPVMITTSGDRLVDSDAVGVMKRKLFPLAAILTPNLYEAEVLTGRKVDSTEDAEEVAREICSWGVQTVVLTGGDSEIGKNYCVDFFFDGEELSALKAPRLPSIHTHGSGCTFASAVAAYLARGLEIDDSVRRAKNFVTRAIRSSFAIGKGRGPVGHFFDLWTPQGNPDEGEGAPD